MEGIGWQFPAILIGAMLLSALMTMLQVRRYNAELQAALKASQGPGDVLVSGRCRSFRGGSVVVLLIDSSTQEITRARAMTGRTVLARFRDRPELLGPVAGAADRAEGRALKEGVQHALLQMPRPHRTLDDTDRTTARRTDRPRRTSQSPRALATR